MKKEEKKYIRTDIKKNTLAKEIIRVDFYPLENFDEVLEKLELYFRDKNYSYTQTTTTNVTYDINDPEPLITESFMVKKNIEIIQNYEFVNINESCKFVVNQNMLIFDKSAFSGYNGIELYFDLFIGAINVIKEITSIKISRIGIRKINELILSKKDSLFRYFNNIYLNDLNSINDETKEMVLEYSFRPFYGINDLSLNKNIKIIKGKYKNTNSDIIDAYSLIWDIDTYRRFVNDTDDLDLNDICKSINEKIFEEYSDVISDELYDYLTQDVESDDILGGINNGAN